MSKIKNKNFTNQGFTLIELLIVMVILGILVAIVFTNIDVGRLTGRGNDTKRISDMRSMQDGILREQAQGYINLTTGTFNSTQSNPSTVDGTGWIKFSTIASAAPANYKFSNLSILPVDPKNGTTNISYSVTGSPTPVTATARYVICVSTNGFEINSLLENDAAKIS